MSGRPTLARIQGTRLLAIDVRTSVMELMLRAVLTQAEFAAIVSTIEPLTFAQLASEVPIKPYRRNMAIDSPIVARRWALLYLITLTLTRRVYDPPLTPLQRIISHALLKGRLSFSTVAFRDSNPCSAYRVAMASTARRMEWGEAPRYQERNRVFRCGARQYLDDCNRFSKLLFPAVLRAARADILNGLAIADRDGYSDFRGEAPARRTIVEKRARLVGAIYSQTRQTVTNLRRGEQFSNEPLSDGEHSVRSFLVGRDIGGRVLNPLANSAETLYAVIPPLPYASDDVGFSRYS